MDHVLARLLRERVLGYLDAVDAQGSAESRQVSAAWRALLGIHETTESGACRECGRRKARMCTVWRVACAYFTPEREPRLRG
ncbi:hypothetical protein FKR81_40500 [Lentzea tibetensis]|uniref:Uncharacterized protein n=1 Tax=Lentzea tibetensis TaxID=2591470 RepID=A0A563EG62_9PSEU|nr:hypothetical protein [Lentzea tibetensis]TWP44885.1 hypothetical protein FKR81_40500 [Lentzea tibetensis]